jgi:hypothetical protein
MREPSLERLSPGRWLGGDAPEPGGKEKVPTYEKLLATLGSVDLVRNLAVGRRYALDYELAVTFEMDGPVPPLPAGVRPLRPDPRREKWVMHVGYIRMRAGNLASADRPQGLPAFEELAWGVQVQALRTSEPYERFPNTYLANKLAGSNAIFRTLSQREDRYPIHDSDDIVFDAEPREHRVSVWANRLPVCSFAFDPRSAPDKDYAVLPIQADTLKSDPESPSELSRNPFYFIGLSQSIEGPRVLRPEFRFWDHPIFDDVFKGRARTGSPVTLMPLSVMVSRPETPAWQILGVTSHAPDRE